MKRFLFASFLQAALLVLLNYVGVPAQTPPSAAPAAKPAGTVTGRVLPWQL